MSAISGVNGKILESQLASVQIQQAIGVKVAKTALDATKAQGAAAIKLLDAVGDMAKQIGTSGKSVPTFGAVVSGLGQSLDVRA